MAKGDIYEDDELYLIERNGHYAMHGTVDGNRIRKSCGTRSLAKAKTFLENFKLEYENGWRNGYEEGDREWKEVAAVVCNRHRAGAAKRGMPFELKPVLIFKMMKAAGFRCTVSGIPFSKRMAEYGKRDPWGPSVDRIENRQGYTLENCRVVCLAANLAMSDWGLDVLLRLSRGIHRSSLVTAQELTRDDTLTNSVSSNVMIRLVK